MDMTHPAADRAKALEARILHARIEANTTTHSNIRRMRLAQAARLEATLRGVRVANILAQAGA